MRTCLTVCAVLVVSAVLAPDASAARDRTPPSTPTNVRVVAVTEDSITISWTASSDNSGRIHAYIAGGIYHPGNSTTKTFTSLVPSYTRSFQVQAMDPSGNVSGHSAPITGTTAPDLTVPTTPGNLRVTGSGLSTVSLAWDRSSDRWSFGYEVLMDGAVLASAAHPFVGTPSTTLRTIAPGTHTFQVRARDWAGNVSGVSNAVTVDAGRERRHHGTDRSVEPDRRGPARQLRQPDPALDGLERRQRRGRVRDLPQRPILVPDGATESFQYTQPGTNTWTVLAVDEAGNRSEPSNAVTLTIVADENLC